MDETERVCRDLGYRVIELRRQRGWTQQTLADRMSIDPRDLRRIEKGDNVTIHTLVRLAGALDVGIGELFVTPTARTQRRPGRPLSPQTLELAEGVSPRRRRGRPGR